MARRADHTREELASMALKAARDIIVKSGAAAFSTREVAARMGYTVGTLYQLFRDAEDLIERVNAETPTEL